MNDASRRQTTKWLALCGIAGPIIFVAAFTIAGLMKPGYSPVHQTISDLGVGAGGWLVDGACVLLWIFLTAFNVSFFLSIRAAGEKLSWICAALLELSPIGFAVAGVFTEAPASLAVHWLVGANLAFFGPVIAFLVTSRVLRRDDQWHGWGTYSFVAFVATLALVAFMFWVFTPNTPLASARVGGLVERVLAMEILAWYAATGLRLTRRGRTPPIA